MKTSYLTGGNVAFVSMDELSEGGASAFGNVVDPAESVEDHVHTEIRYDAVTEIVAEMAVSDPRLAEVLARTLGLGGWPPESTAVIARSLDETPDHVRGMFNRATADFKLRAYFHPQLAYLMTAA